MLQPKLHRTDAGEIAVGLEVDLRHLDGWHPTVEQVRDTVLSWFVVGPNNLAKAMGLPPEALAAQPTIDEVEHINTCCYDAVMAGRLIDFGDLTQDVIMHGGKRGGSLYNRGIIGHPFRNPWLLMHTWEGETCVYMVNPLEPEKSVGGDCEVIELNPVRFGEAMRVLMIADRAFLCPNYGQDRHQEYRAAAIPSIWRYFPGAEVINKQAPANAAAANTLDPLMTALLILNTRGIARETVRVSDKLAKARRKSGKPPIPPYDRVNSAPYVTAIAARKARGRRLESRGGTHASPIPHLRMGHLRTYANGVQTFVRDALVNMSEEAKAQFARSHYAVKP